MGGGADQFHAPDIRLMIRLGTLESWQEGMVDIDRPSRQCPAQFRGENLHVASEHHQLRAGTLNQIQNLPFLLGLGRGDHRQMVKRDRVPLRQMRQTGVIGHDSGDLHRQRSDAMPVQ